MADSANLLTFSDGLRDNPQDIIDNHYITFAYESSGVKTKVGRFYKSELIDRQVPQFDEIFSTFTNEIGENSTSEDVLLGQIEQLRDAAATTEKSFLKHFHLGGERDLDNPQERASIFTSLMNLKDFFKVKEHYLEPGRQYLSMLLDQDSFRRIVRESIIDAAQILNQNNISETTTSILGQVVHQNLAKFNNDYFGCLLLNGQTLNSGESIYQALEKIYGQGTLERRLQRVIASLNSGTTLKQSQIHLPRNNYAGEVGYIDELIDFKLIDIVKELEKSGAVSNVKINSASNAGIKTTSTKEFHGQSSINLNEEGHKVFSDGIPQIREVAQKVDNEFDIEITDLDGTIFGYNFKISDKFRSDPLKYSMVLQDSAENFDYQITRYHSIFSENYPDGDALFDELIFILLNLCVSGYFQGDSNRAKMENTLNKINSVFMFDNIATDILDNQKPGLLLFRINAGYLPASCIFQAILDVKNSLDSNRSLFITSTLNVSSYDVNQEEYTKFRSRNLYQAPWQQRAAYIRDAVIHNGAIKIRTKFNTALLQRYLNLDRFLVGNV